MAPALIDNTIVDHTVENDSAEKEYLKHKKQEVYKEAFAQSAHTTNYEAEINGTPDSAPAKYPHYLPCKSIVDSKQITIIQLTAP